MNKIKIARLKYCLSIILNSDVVRVLIFLAVQISLPYPVVAASNDKAEFPEINMSLPSLSLDVLSTGTLAKVETSQFFLTTTGAQVTEFPVHVALGFDEKNQELMVEFEFLNDQYLEQNNYVDDNSAMWNQEVFEMFISSGADTPERYMEVQLNPNGVLFSAWVINPNGIGTKNTIDFFDGHGAGIKASVVKEQNAWSGKILLPLSIFETMRGEYRLNMFRIASLQPHDKSTQWGCTATSCAFLAWSPTFSGATPAFHIPEYFGHLYLK